jgi:hypothetical protein
MRTDDNNNPTAFTTDIAREAGLIEGIEYEKGTPFSSNHNSFDLITAKILGDAVEVTIKVLNAVGYYTRGGAKRWDYIAIPAFVWSGLSYYQKRDVIGFHYQREGGTKLKNLFPNFGEK